MKKLVIAASLCGWTLWGQTHPLQELIEAARAQSPALKDLLAKRSPYIGMIPAPCSISSHGPRPAHERVRSAP